LFDEVEKELERFRHCFFKRRRCERERSFPPGAVERVIPILRWPYCRVHVKDYSQRRRPMTIDLEKRIAALEERVQILDILQLEGEYSRSWDFGSGEEWASLFTEDGVFVMRPAVSVAPLPAGQGAKIEGRGALAEFRAAFDSGWSFLHQMHLPSCRINGETAEAVMFFECPIKASDNEGRAAISREVGIYKVQYRRTAEGWKIARRIEEALRRDSMFYFGRPESNLNLT
jgi:hypothetical protein